VTALHDHPDIESARHELCPGCNAAYRGEAHAYPAATLHSVSADAVRAGDVLVDGGIRWPVVAVLHCDSTSVELLLTFPSSLQKPVWFDAGAELEVLR
jgi:hypothetical protein